MKKYVKPEIVFERFELSKHVANCYFEVTSEDVGSCVGVAEDGSGITIFTNTSVCTIAVPLEGSSIEDYCYMGSVDGKTTFQS